MNSLLTAWCQCRECTVLRDQTLNSKTHDVERVYVVTTKA